jgi:NADPH:quinone reductase-like Zn-dependent oxidoreductase
VPEQSNSKFTLEEFLDAAAGQVRVPTGRICTLDQVARAHADLESGQVTGKLVVTTS